ncbi:MAG: MBL fold metallo-hydrolase [Verrucomicrobiales bacterium]|nr:MBL fold metallo-hydrolase [Verrucomicrobiales bacterium]
MRVTNLNPAHNVGASAWLVEFEDHRILLDAGVHPKHEGREALPLYDRIEGSELDAIALSHCHHDHVGSLPVAVRKFPKAHVLMTELSYFIVDRVLHNSVNVMMRQRDELGITDYPMFTHTEVEEISAIFQGFRYNREVEWAAFAKTRAGQRSPTIEFLDAGHALGSAGTMIRGADSTLFYTGDVAFHDQTLLKGARFEDVQADVMIMETTRGAREVPPDFSRDSEIQRLAQAIREVQKRKGSILIPVFALGRTQEILALLALLMASGELPRQSVYIGGLGRVFTEIYDLQAHRTHRHHSNLALTEALDLQVLERRQMETIKLGGGKLFVLTSGMMNPNTAAFELALRMMEDERHGIFFVGYADPDTPAGKLRATPDGAKFSFGPQDRQVTRRCQVLEFDLTAHANRAELLALVGRVAPKAVILGHGEADARQWFREQIHQRHPRIKVFDPGPAETVEA